MQQSSMRRRSSDQHRGLLAAIIATTLLAPQVCRAQVGLTTSLQPAEFAGAGRSILSLELEAQSPLAEGAVISVTSADTDFEVDQSSPYLVPSGALHASTTFTVRAHDPASAHTNGVLLVRVRQGQRDDGQVLVVANVGFSFHPQISSAAYVQFALLGLALGWILKRLIKYLAPIPDPAELSHTEIASLQAERSARSFGDKLREFLTRWFDLVDALITLILGLAIVLGLMEGGAPPSVASTVPAALVLGMGIGTLGNTELFGRLRRG